MDNPEGKVAVGAPEETARTAGTPMTSNRRVPEAPVEKVGRVVQEAKEEAVATSMR
jgi:hypothetical protein